MTIKDKEGRIYGTLDSFFYSCPYAENESEDGYSYSCLHKKNDADGQCLTFACPFLIELDKHKDEEDRWVDRFFAIEYCTEKESFLGDGYLEQKESFEGDKIVYCGDEAFNIFSLKVEKDERVEINKYINSFGLRGEI